MNLSVHRTLSVSLVLFAGSQALFAADPSPGLRFEKEIKAYEAADQKSPPPEAT